MPDWDWKWHAEIEKFPSEVMAARHPGSVNLGDVSAHDFTQRAAAIARPNVLVFGSPCQSFSVAGKRLGLDDPRGNLALVALGIVDRLKPDWFVFENVPGLLSSGDGRDFGSFLGTVADIGYFGVGDVLDAQWFGVAQRRQRMFFVGNPRDWRHSAAVLLEPESMCGNYPPRREAGERPAPTIASRPTGGGGLGTDLDCDGGLIASHDVAQPLLAKGNSSHRADAESYVAHALRADGFDASEDGTGRGTPLVSAYRTSGNCGAWETGDRVDALNTGTDPSSHLVQAVALRGREGGGTAELSEVPSALRAAGGGGDKAHVLAPAIAGTLKAAAKSGTPNGAEEADRLIGQGSAVRRLTPRECERLQGFPDDYTLIEYRGKPAADGPRYKALGNSMAVPVVRWILSRIEMFETQVKPKLSAMA